MPVAGPRRPLVRLLIPNAGNGRNFGLVRAINDAIHLRHRWILEVAVDPHPEAFLAQWRRQPADAVLAVPTAPFQGGALHGLGVPTLTLLIEDLPLPCILPDDEGIGRLAAQHLRCSGWTPHAVLPFASRWAAARVRGWRQEIGQGTVSLLPAPAAALDAWVAALPPATALFAVNDSTALEVANAARRQGRAMGHDLRLMGVDDEIDCLLTTPALSSIPLPLRALGGRAVTTLAQMLQGKSVPPRQVVPATGVVVRASSDPLVQAPPWLRDLADEIRMTVASGQPAHLGHLLARQTVHRTTVSRAWRAVTGLSLRAWVQQQRREVALQRLADGLPEEQVARSLGYGSLRALQRMLQASPR